ncbi:hypothetical protein HK100_005765 [Physocladia obscura]|uniref:Uncharacterized protein n=1 Tax=Physocladia obscura TaxID=109957 RepID=A0AAD5X7W4_9FUNG|nr:hypothetical protein HK100_005765 [Physocladia obscura]
MTANQQTSTLKLDDALPTEILSAIYKQIPLQTIRTRMLGLSKRHRALSIARIVGAIRQLHLTLVSDTPAPLFLDLEYKLPTKLLYQRHVHCSLAKTGATLSNSSSDGDLHVTLAFAGTCPMVNITRACAVRRIKFIIYEDYNNGSAATASADSALIWDGPQMGVMIAGADSLQSLIVTDNTTKLHSHDLIALFDEAKVLCANNKYTQISTPAHESDRGIERVRKIGRQLNRAIGVVPDIENFVRLSHPSSTTKNSELNLLVDTEKLDCETKMILKWDAFIFEKDSSEIGVSLLSAVVPIAAILEGFVRYSSGLDDVDTEDGDSEWKSEYDEDDFDDDIDALLYGDDGSDGDSGGYATDY